jgi:secreted PhoX family phosphatase
MTPGSQVLSRRQFVGSAALGAGVLAFGPTFWRDALAAPATPGPSPYGPLNPPDANGLMLPAGFSSREIARSGAPVAGYPWHIFPDGQATFATRDGGWILVSNSESYAAQGGGASAIEFGADGVVERAYRILGGTDRNCSGGHTPWGTYLSCEEWDGGQVWECDPTGQAPAAPRPAMGTFTHESACVDPVHKRVYMTEDEKDGRLYRFTPLDYPDLSSGRLEVARIRSDDRVRWRTVPDPSAITAPTRKQVRSTRFSGGEGMWFDSGIVYFTTKGDNKVHAYDTRNGRYELIYDEATHPDSPLSGLDGITVARSGDLYLCEDGGDSDICLITPDRVVSRFLTLTGEPHADSELTGVVFAPSGSRLYFSSMRAYGQGATYEVTGPFRGRGRTASPLAMRAGAIEGSPEKRRLRVRAREQIRVANLLRRGIRVRIEITQPGTVSLALRTGQVLSSLQRGETAPQPRQFTLARASRRVTRAGGFEVRLRLNREARRMLRGGRASRARLTAQLTTAGGTVEITNHKLRLQRG